MSQKKEILNHDIFLNGGEGMLDVNYVSVLLTNDDKSYDYFVDWLSEQPESENLINFEFDLNFKNKYCSNDEYDSNSDDEENLKRNQNEKKDDNLSNINNRDAENESERKKDNLNEINKDEIIVRYFTEEVIFDDQQQEYIPTDSLNLDQRKQHELKTRKQNSKYRFYLPAPGIVHIRIRGRLMQLESSRFVTAFGQTKKTLKLTICGKEKHFLEHIIEEAVRLGEARESNKLTIYKSNAIFADWEKAGPSRRKRPLSTVVLDRGITENFLSDINEFLNSKKWYHQRGIPYRRGYLLYGPPGCGKSSFIKAIASELNFGICLLNLNDKKCNDDILMKLIYSIPDKSFVLIEDVDLFFSVNEKLSSTDTFFKEINQHNDFENKDGELQNKEDKFNSKPKKTNQRNYNDNINSNLGAEEEKITDSSKSIQNENLIIEKISISCQASNSHSKQTSARDNNKKVEHNVSFSAFINMLDGIASKEGLVIMMTTNNINALDSTFLRAGRIDRLQKIDYPSDYQIKELFCRFYPNASPILAEEFVRKHKATKRLVSVAEIQGHLLTNKFDPIRAITSLNRGI